MNTRLLYLDLCIRLQKLYTKFPRLPSLPGYLNPQRSFKDLCNETNVTWELNCLCTGEGSNHAQDTMWKVMGTKTYERAVVCRNSVFPYAVFECHDISKGSNMHIINVEMQGHDGSRINEVAACHEASLGSDHSVNNLSKAANSAETRSACHWVTDALIWAPTN